MTTLRLIYSDHVVSEMRKAGITRQLIRLTIQYGLREFEMERKGELHYRSTLDVENKTYRVQWIQQARQMFIVTVFIVGEYD